MTKEIDIGQLPPELTDFDKQISFFLKTLYGNSREPAVLNICAKKNGRNGIQTISFPSDKIDDISNKIISMRDYEDIYFETCLQSERPAPGKRGDAKSKTVMPGIWMDIDVAGPGHASSEYPQTKEEALEFAKELGSTLVVDSGGGLHAYFLFDEPWIFNDETEREKAQASVQYSQKLIIEKGKEHDWKLDNTSDLARLLRIPGTFNHKAESKREVNIIYFNDDIRCTPDMFEPPLVEEGPDNLPLVKQAYVSPTDGQYPPSDALKVIEHCGFMKHCVDDAATLTEPEWFHSLSIFSHAEDGNRLCHLYSSPYPGYSYDETEKKIAHVLTMPPITCEKIQTNAKAELYCSRCSLRTFIKSPIRLGDSSQKVQLLIQGAKILVGAYNDPGLPFENENLQVLEKLRRQQPETYSRIRSAIAKKGISVKSLEAAIDKLAYSIIDVGAAEQYVVYENRMYFRKQTQYGDKPVLLSNFNAKITEQIIKDDGVNRSIVFKIVAQLYDGSHLPVIEVPAEEFRSMGWVTMNYGVGAIIQPGQSNTDHLRTAIQSLSTDCANRTVYTHTGWRKINDEWFFLTANGALGANGLVENVEVALEGKLRHYGFQKTLLEYPPADAVRASLEMLKLAPPRIAIPLLCATYRAPLEEALPCQLTVFIEGKTGSFKSQLTALGIAHFGQDFDGKNLTAEWTSTANALEKMAFIAKDTIFVIDDFYPGLNQNDAMKINKIADQIIRGKGNQSGRTRMYADGRLRETYIPRSLIWTSGEDIPRGQSLQARMYIVEVVQDNIDTGVLTNLQKLAKDGMLAAAMVGFIQYLAPKLDDLKISAPQRKIELRNEVIQNVTAHSRTPDIIADLLFGLEQFLEYVVHVGVYTAEQAQELRNTAVKTLLESNKMFQEVFASGNPVRRFCNLLLAAFTTGAVHLEGIQGGEPSNNAEQWGWKTIPGCSSKETKPGSKLIGWVDGINLYLNPEVAFTSVQEIANKQGSPIMDTPRTIRKRLHEESILIKNSPTKYTKVKTIGGTKQNVIHLLSTKLFDDEESTAADESQSAVETEGNSTASITDIIERNLNCLMNKDKAKNPFSDDLFNDNMFLTEPRGVPGFSPLA
jgi:hypothetical protein